MPDPDLPHVPPSPSSTASNFALWQLGFRPFYLLASGFAALSIAAWAAQALGWLPWAYLKGPAWHAHEMVFGFTLAVMVGFLFTAGRNWSGQPTPTGLPLALLALLWLLARILILTPLAGASAATNALFAWACAWALAQALVAGGNRRNYFFVALLVAMGLASIAVYLGYRGVLQVPVERGIQVALDIVLFVMAVIGGRVIPMFTNNGVPGANAARNLFVERVALGAVLALLSLDLIGMQGQWLSLVLALGALAHGVRLALWQPWRTLGTPLVWILHAAYLWIPVHLALRAAATWQIVPATLSTHALTVGAIGGLTLGMMTRTARGHTARPLLADRFDLACYLLVLGAAVLRVLLPLLIPSAYSFAIAGSAICWSLAYGAYAVRYWPWLSRARLDGKPG